MISIRNHDESKISGEIEIISYESYYILIISKEIEILSFESSLLRENCNSILFIEILLRKISTFISLMTYTFIQIEYIERNHLYNKGIYIYQCKYQGLYQDTEFELNKIINNIYIDLFWRDFIYIYFMK